MEEKERETTTMDELCPDLIDAVLRRVPLLPRTRLKPVSKAWCHHITTLRHTAPPTSSTGLVISYSEFNDDPKLHRSSLFRIQENSNSLSLACTPSHSYRWLVNSCNGLVLYAKTNETHNWVYCVSSPVLNQYRILPQRHKSEILARESLAFDGSHRGNFKVVSFFFQDIDVSGGKIECQIFSSETGGWREIEAPLINSFLLLQNGFQVDDITGQSVYRKGKLYWVWSVCMLVFDEDEESFELVNLPKSAETGERKKKRMCFSYTQLWESDGKINYCESTREGYRVWKYCDNDYDDDENRWEAKRLIVLDKLKSREMEVVDLFGERMKVRVSEGMIWPCAFNEDFQLVYFQVGPRTIFSYSFETGEFEEIWGSGNPVETQNYFFCYVCPYLFNSVNLVKREFDAG
ncbi:hypothetical protein Vadar_016796 [Vaccinium darrowii]|uniref:Uncharacterized protein n=1 Tax=Vaccinium darrowii TaxID=229202 RepID=A0ACB7XZG8_9ERIC|nr:hypothetical protein Vadar_016796 [Vaccinium darrowii]